MRRAAAGELQAFDVGTPVELAAEYANAGQADYAALVPGAERYGDRGVRVDHRRSGDRLPDVPGGGSARRPRGLSLAASSGCPTRRVRLRRRAVVAWRCRRSSAACWPRSRASRTPRPNMRPISGIVFGPRQITTMIRTMIRTTMRSSHGRDGTPPLAGTALRRRGYRAGRADPLLVFGPRSTTYDFGPSHPLTPRRFGPGISLLEALGAVPGLAPEPATDEELGWIHDAAYIEHREGVLARIRDGPPRAGIGPGDTPRVRRACTRRRRRSRAGRCGRWRRSCAATSSTRSSRAAGSTTRCRPRASGFCVYDDPALAIARARRDGLRVLYIDLDVHHGDGVQAIHWADPGVLTVSIHETGLDAVPGDRLPGRARRRRGGRARR